MVIIMGVSTGGGQGEMCPHSAKCGRQYYVFSQPTFLSRITLEQKLAHLSLFGPFQMLAPPPPPPPPHTHTHTFRLTSIGCAHHTHTLSGPLLRF